MFQLNRAACGRLHGAPQAAGTARPMSYFYIISIIQLL